MPLRQLFVACLSRLETHPIVPFGPETRISIGSLEGVLFALSIPSLAPHLFEVKTLEFVQIHLAMLILCYWSWIVWKRTGDFEERSLYDL